MANTKGNSNRSVDGTKKKEDVDALNLTGLKHQLHGASYQLKLGIVVSLAKIEKLKEPSNDFSFTVLAEGREDSKGENRDRAVDKFDDIVYKFQDGATTGTLKIQAKHKLIDRSIDSITESPKVTLSDFIPHKQENVKQRANEKQNSKEKQRGNESKKKKQKETFAIDEYYGSFKDQQQHDKQQRTTADIAGYILSTNAILDDNAKVLWTPIDATVIGDSTTSLNFYISTIFGKTGGKCYKLETHYKRAALARLLINATKSIDGIVTWQKPLINEYLGAIKTIIVKKNNPGPDCVWEFRDSFLHSNYSNSSPGYEAFRKEFEDQYLQEFKFEGTVWEHLKKNNKIYVSKNFLSDQNNLESSSSISSAIFPDDNVDESLKLFCERFSLVCGTYNEQGLDEVITTLWRELYFDDGHLAVDRWKGCLEGKVATDNLIKRFFDWMADPRAKILHSDDIKKDLENIESTLAYIKLKGASEKLRKKVASLPFRISHDALKSSELYDRIETESYFEVETYDVQFAAVVLLEILVLQHEDRVCTLLVEDTDFTSNADTVEKTLRFIEDPIFMIIICNDAMKSVQSIVRKWKKDILKTTAKQVFLIRKTSNTPTDFSNFRLSDLTNDSWKQFLSENISLCGTTIAADKLFRNKFQIDSIEEVIKLLDDGNQIAENNEIVKNYREIKDTYVHRCWIDQQINVKAENVDWSSRGEMYDIFENISNTKQEEISFAEITKRIKEDLSLLRIFAGLNPTNLNNPANELKPIDAEDTKKVLILLAEAGGGKTTNLTWLARHLQKQNPSSWIVRCNLSDHCTDFKDYMRFSEKSTGTVTNEIEAMRMLYKLVHLTLQNERENAQNCSNCLVLSGEKVSVSEELVKHHGLSLSSMIQLQVFKEKFNAGELVLLLDGFDEIAPDYKEVVLKLLSLFEQFDGVNKLYLTSRPYSFKRQFEEAFVKPVFYQLKPLRLCDKVSILYKMMKVKWRYGNIDDKEISDFYKSLCFMLLYHLGDMSDIPLNLMMSIDILGNHFYHNQSRHIHFPLKTCNIKLFEPFIGRSYISKASVTVEEFLKIKIRQLLYDKNGADKIVADKPSEIPKIEKAIDEAKMLHGLVALRVLFDKSVLADNLSANEMSEAEHYTKKISDGSEKTGIIHGIRNDVPMFIHRTFAEYLAAWWIVKRRIEVTQPGSKLLSLTLRSRQQYSKLSTQQQHLLDITGSKSFLVENGLMDYIDVILAKHCPLHLAIIENDWKKVKLLFTNEPEHFNKKDGGNRTYLHLWVRYGDLHNGPCIFNNLFRSNIINIKDNLMGWTALDYAFYRENRALIFYLLHHGASINVDVLYRQVILSQHAEVCSAVRYANYIMKFLSLEAIEYESHDACKKMKQFCGRVAKSLVNVMPKYFPRTIDYHNNNRDYLVNFFDKGSLSLNYIFFEDSPRMLESIIQHVNQEEFFQMFKHIALLNGWKWERQVFLLKYFAEKEPSLLDKKKLWMCIETTVQMDYKNEFKFFFDLYCSRFEIEHFMPCSIQSDKACYLITAFDEVIIRKVYAIKDIILQNTPIEITLNKSILKLLIICVVGVRPSMLKYMIQSCKLNLSAGIVYHLAKVTYRLLKELQAKTNIQASQAYVCLLYLAPSISNIEATNLLRLSVTSDLLDFSKCLMKRYNIDFEAVDEVNGWNVFHLCVSHQRSPDVEEIVYNGNESFNVNDGKTDFFRYMLENQINMDCFDKFDHKNRSILYLAIENEQDDIVTYILARKLGLNSFDEINNLTVDAISNLTFCYRAIHEIMKSVGVKWFYRDVICILVKQIAKLSLIHPQETNSNRLFLENDAKELYQIAMERRSLFLVYYLQREFPWAIPAWVYDAHWLACTAKSLKSSDFFDVTKWLVNAYNVDEYVKFYNVVEKCDIEKCDLSLINLEELVKQVDANLSTYQSVEDACKMKLVVLAVCLNREPAIRFLFKTFNVNIDVKCLLDIMKIAHHATGRCKFDEFDFAPIYKYLFEQIGNLYELDAEGRNVLHIAVKSGPSCMAMYLIKHYMFNVMTTNEQNGWNIFHYCASRKVSLSECCNTENENLLAYITKRVFEITSDDEGRNVMNYLANNFVQFNKMFAMGCTTGSQMNKIKELCFTSNDRRKSAIHVAVGAGNIGTVVYIICSRLGVVTLGNQIEDVYQLGINSIRNYKIMSSNECSQFRECYEAVYQATAQFPFNAKCDYLLHSLCKTIYNFSQQNILQIIKQKSVADHIIDDACLTAIRYRDVSTLERLIIAYQHQIHQSLARSTGTELLACMTECIRLNRISIFKVLVSHYRNIQGIKPGVEVQYENDDEKGNANNDEAMIDEHVIQWSVFDQSTDQGYLSLLALSVAYGRLSMAQYLNEMLELAVNKSMILLIMKSLHKLSLYFINLQKVVSVYEYLASISEGNPNLLHLYVQARIYNIIKYLLEDKHYHPNETDLESGWNAGHYCVSEPASDTNSTDAVFKLIMKNTNMDYLGVYDRKGRSILHLALENGYTDIVKYLVNHKLGREDGTEPWQEWDLKKIEEYIKELKQMMASLPSNVPSVLQVMYERIKDRKVAITTYHQLMKS
ncbi:uncharacterized protein LOC125949899 [Anopheles darlingi]|uniref:uncharacterized protein LOC125949899 n=1 Tax=Anopheles darlingi TaxID=43151 RepID=UPI002100176F|nr:uncharacterized protein LOC125949899 [Anopheles darlingi]XP_049533320.1 uncharacterized protein LOC125949899 [Anopheles darlingi]XP_049533321.1 uncharacterized protein LOC125949899 [Anopheles darlingi]